MSKIFRASSDLIVKSDFSKVLKIEALTFNDEVLEHQFDVPKKEVISDDHDIADPVFQSLTDMLIKNKHI